jgi:hypothetical protein
MALRGGFEAMLAAWRAAGTRLVAVREVLAPLDPKYLPRHEISMQPVPGRSGLLASQGPRVG